jgi:hypothetical protein
MIERVQLGERTHEDAGATSDCELCPWSVTAPLADRALPLFGFGMSGLRLSSWREGWMGEWSGRWRRRHELWADETAAGRAGASRLGHHPR